MACNAALTTVGAAGVLFNGFEVVWTSIELPFGGAGCEPEEDDFLIDGE